MVSNYNLFSSQLDEVIQSYDGLKRIASESNDYLKGIIDIPNDDGEIIGSFLIEIRFNQKFPLRFPKLFEVGGEIPDEPDWHINEDHSCCITVEPEEILMCERSITLVQFVKNHVIPFLANHIYRKTTGNYKNGEYAHGIKGYLQFYEKLFKTSDRKLWNEYMSYTFSNKRISCGRNDLCMCGSQLKYKHCHYKIFDTLKHIGKNNITNHLSYISLL